MMRLFFLFMTLISFHAILIAQDPHFSQFFMAPQFVNPAITGTGSSDWRLMCNWRQQWGNAGTPFNTQAVSGDIKITGTGGEETEEVKNTLAIAGSLMLDQTMSGAFKSSYLSTSVAYHKAITTNETLGLGIQGMYGNRTIDYSKLTFGEQFSSGGFDVTLPTGELALSKIKPIFSLSAGLNYNYTDEKFNLDIGAAAFHINKPRQTFLNDPNEYLSPRYLLHCNAEINISDGKFLDLNGCYQEQATVDYFSLGGAIGIDVSGGEKNTILFAGAWYRDGDSFYPFLSWRQQNVQFGFSYDVTHSKQNQGPSNPRSFEVSLVITKKKVKEGVIECPSPWK